MNFGSQQIRDIIFDQAKRAGLRGYPLGKFAKDTSKMIYELIEESEPTVSKKEWNLVHNFPQDLEPIIRQLNKGFNFQMKRDDEAIEVYRWLAEQGKDKIKQFILWATDVERVQFVGKYRNTPGYIKNDWKIAFTSQGKAVTHNEDGSLHV
jgi:hypothetical protein